MHAEVEPVDQASDRQHIEYLHVLLVRCLVVQVEHLVAEIERLCHVACLVVPPQQKDLVRVLELQAEEVNGDLGPIVTPVHIVAQEQQLVLLPAVLDLAQHGQHVVELTVDVADDTDLSLDSD